MAVQRTITICGVEYNLKFDKGNSTTPPTLKLVNVASPSTVYTGRLDCAGCNYAIFAFFIPTVCIDTRDPRGPCFDVFRLRVEWTCCPLDGWHGPGWYCVVGAGGNCADARPVELLEIDKCNSTIKICSGPYATEPEALLSCAPLSAPSTSCVSNDGDAVAVGQTVRFGTPVTGVNYFHVPVTAGAAYKISAHFANAGTRIIVYPVSPVCVGGTPGPALYDSGTIFSGDIVCADIGTIPVGAACVCVQIFMVYAGNTGAFTINSGACP